MPYLQPASPAPTGAATTSTASVRPVGAADVVVSSSLPAHGVAAVSGAPALVVQSLVSHTRSLAPAMQSGAGPAGPAGASLLSSLLLSPMHKRKASCLSNVLVGDLPCDVPPHVAREVGTQDHGVPADLVASLQQAPSSKRIRLAHSARIRLALAGGALGDGQLSIRAEEPPGQVRGQKRVSFCPETQVIQVDSQECFDFPLARRRRGQPSLEVSSAASSELDVATWPVCSHEVFAELLGPSVSSTSSTSEPCILSPTGAALHECAVGGQSPVVLSDGDVHASVRNSVRQQPHVAASVVVSAPPASGAPARILTATVGALAQSAAPATAVPLRTSSGGNEDARARSHPSIDGSALQQDAPAATGGTARSRQTGERRRQLTLADFWR